MIHSQISLSFPAVAGKPITAAFDGGDITSDAGLLLVSETDRRLGIKEALLGCMEDRRQPGKVQHPLLELVQSRVYAIAQGYSDGNDLDRLRHVSALMNGMRGLLKGTAWQKAQMGVIRLRLLKVGARVVESSRRIWFHLPSSYPSKREWELLVSRLQDINAIPAQTMTPAEAVTLAEPLTVT